MDYEVIYTKRDSFFSEPGDRLTALVTQKQLVAMLQNGLYTVWACRLVNVADYIRNHATGAIGDLRDKEI